MFKTLEQEQPVSINPLTRKERKALRKKLKKKSEEDNYLLGTTRFSRFIFRELAKSGIHPGEHDPD